MRPRAPSTPTRIVTGASSHLGRPTRRAPDPASDAREGTLRPRPSVRSSDRARKGRSGTCRAAMRADRARWTRTPVSTASYRCPSRAVTPSGPAQPIANVRDSSKGPMTVSGLRRREDRRGLARDVLEGDRVDPGQEPVDARQLAEWTGPRCRSGSSGSRCPPGRARWSPWSGPCPASSSSAVRPSRADLVQRRRPSARGPGRPWPAGSPRTRRRRPTSAKPELNAYTEYARPRRSRISWNSREDMPPPSAVLRMFSG